MKTFLCRLLVPHESMGRLPSFPMEYTAKLSDGASMFLPFVMASATRKKYLVSICFSWHLHLVLCRIPGVFSTRAMARLTPDIKLNEFFRAGI